MLREFDERRNLVQSPQCEEAAEDQAGGASRVRPRTWVFFCPYIVVPWRFAGEGEGWEQISGFLELDCLDSFHALGLGAYVLGLLPILALILSISGSSLAQPNRKIH